MSLTNDSATTQANTQVTIPVLSNDTVANADLRITAVLQPPASQGTVAVSADQRSLIFTPAAGFSGTAQFTYQVGLADNDATVTVTVEAAPPPPTGQPDLTVLAIRWSQDEGATWHQGPIEPGKNVWLQSDVRNIGTGPTPQGTIIGVAFRTNGVARSWSDTHTAALPPDTTITLSANGGPDGNKYWDAAAVTVGTHTVRAHVDDINRIPNELNETNNILEVQATVQAIVRPDLIVSSVRWSHDDGAIWHTGSVPVGSNVWFEADVRNQGNGPTPDGVILSVAFQVNAMPVAFSDNHSASLAAGATVSLRANTGPDGDKYWNNVQAGSYTVTAYVDDAGRIPESDEANNTLDAQVTVQDVAPPPPPPPPPTGVTVGSVTGGGNLHRSFFPAQAYRVQNLVDLKCGRARTALSASEYFGGGAPSPALCDTMMTMLLNARVKPFIIFEWAPTQSPPPQKNYADWFAIGAGFATRFKPNSSFLTGQGITGIGITEYSAINEPDRHRGESGTTYAQYHAMLEGLGDGVHSVDPAGKVYPAGYLSANRDRQYTGFGYLSSVADLLNDGTLAGFDLHCYHQQFAPLGDLYNRCPQSDFDKCISASGITRPVIDLVSTEWNAAGGTFPSSGGYDQELWYMQLWFNMQGLVLPNGALAGGARLPWHIWRPQAPENDMCSQLDPRIETSQGIFFRRIMEHTHDKVFVSANPRTTGVYKLKGGGKTIWAWQNHQNWTTLGNGSATTFTISDIPAATTQVTVWDGNAVVARVPSKTVNTPALQKPQHTFTGLSKRCWMFIANAE